MRPSSPDLTALVAGIVLVNVMTEELPRRSIRRFFWFLLGLGFFIAVIAGVLVLR